MLNRDLFACKLNALGEKLFFSHEHQKPLAFEVWKRITQDESFKKRTKQAKSSFLIPDWDENLDSVFCGKSELKEYAVLAVDGSQIYPDRHLSGINCLLINTGGCLLEYGHNSKVSFFSEPSIFLPEQLSQNISQKGDVAFSVDLVDLTREAFEFNVAFDKSLAYTKAYPEIPFACLVDGSIIFWHLEGKPQEVRDYFLNEYLNSLQKFYEHSILVAGYISFPKSKELINLVRLGLCRFSCAQCIECHRDQDIFPCKDVDHVLDTQLCRYFLQKAQRTTLFYSNSNITEYYPAHLKPCFFYLDVGAEIIRIECPRWVAHNPASIEQICSIVLDQATKGYGYPVVLAEAHEQAVIKGGDRDFFYHALCKKSLDANQRVIMSPKSIKKRMMGI